MKIKRIFAYIIDLFLISLITQFILMIPVFSNISDRYTESASEYFELVYKSTSGSSDIDADAIIEKTYEVQKNSQTINIITIGLLILYFGVTAYICNGQTIGKKILKLKIVPAKGKVLNPSLFILRAIIVTNLIPRILMIFITSYCTPSTWYTYSNIIANAQYMILFLILGFMIFRDDERGLHDIICNTKVIKVEATEQVD